jgi:hypothetical protein
MLKLKFGLPKLIRKNNVENLIFGRSCLVDEQPSPPEAARGAAVAFVAPHGARDGDFSVYCSTKGLA